MPAAPLATVVVVGEHRVSQYRDLRQRVWPCPPPGGELEGILEWEPALAGREA